MNLKPVIALLSSLFIFFISCKKDDAVENPILQFVGNYEIKNQHITGLHEVSDSVGNIIDYEEQTTEVIHDFTISDADLVDSLTLNGLIKSWNGDLQKVKVVLKNDSLNIIFNENDIIRNDYIIGKIWIKGDSIFANYRWDRSDTWSAGATPVYGKVSGKGVRLD